MSGPFFVNGVQVAMPPPEGYVVDFDNPQRNQVINVYWHYGIGNAFALLAIAQRLYVRLCVQKHVFLEDAFLGVAYVFSLVFQSWIVQDFMRGVVGVHTWEMPIEKFFIFVTSNYKLPALFTPVYLGTKISLLLVYNRLTPELWFQYPVWITIFVVVAWTFVLEVLLIFPCQPIAAAWDLTITNATCLDRQAIFTTVAIMGAVTDTMVLAVPMPILWKLQRPRREKIGLAAIFGMGILTVVTAIMRLKTIIQSMGKVDQPWGAADVVLWVFAEANLSIICGSLLTIKIFISSIAPNLLGAARSGSHNTPGRRQSISGPPELVTFGGSGRDSSKKTAPRRDKYERFDDERTYPLTTFVDVQAEAGEHGGRAASQPADMMSGDASDGSGNDAESTRGIVVPRNDTIVRTQTTVVSYQSQ